MSHETTRRVLLETERMVLRAFTDADEGLLVELDSDPEVMRWLNGGVPTPPEYVEREILPRFTSYDDRFGFWAAFRKGEDDFLGWFSLRRHDTDEAALGYRLRRAAWGQGYATEGGHSLIRLAFEELGMKRVMAGTYEHNSRSLRVMQRLGMRERCRHMLTAEDLAASDTFDPGSQTVWDGADIEYEIDIDEWRQRQPIRPTPSP
jgi:RimJ/RimL family protein N-acetyltransferase